MVKTFLAILMISIHLFSYSQEKFSAEVINYETTVTLKNNKLSTNNSREILINDREGETYTTVRIPSSEQKKIVKIEAYIKDRGGAIVSKLEKNDIVKKSEISEGSLYEDSYINEFSLKHNQYPYTLFVNFQTQEDQFLQLTHWIPVLGLNIPTRRATIRLILPSGFKISPRYSNTDSYKTEDAGSDIVYIWTASYSDILKPEIYSPNISDYLPYVHIVSENFKYDIPGSLQTWIDYGNWHYSLLQNLSNLSTQEKYGIMNLVEGITDKREKIRVLFQYLQDNTRYINISIETGGMKPYPASYVSLNKYGDCKALTNYFKAMLEAVGIASYYTLVNAGEPIKKIDKSFPSQQFNHAILCVPLSNDTLWLDCTSKLPFGYIGTFIQGRDALVIVKDNSHFSRIPSLKYAGVTERRRITVNQVLLAPASVNCRNTYQGKEYETLVYLLKTVSESDKLRLLKTYYIDDGLDLTDYTISVPDRVPSIDLFYTAQASGIYKIFNDVTLINVLPFDVPQPEDPERRKLPVQISYPVFKVDTIDYQIPFDCEPDTSLLNTTITCEFGEYKIQTATEGKYIRIIKSLLITEGLVSKEKYRDFHSFITKINFLERNHKIVTRKKTSL